MLLSPVAVALPALRIAEGGDLTFYDAFLLTGMSYPQSLVIPLQEARTRKEIPLVPTVSCADTLANAKSANVLSSQEPSVKSSVHIDKDIVENVQKTLCPPLTQQLDTHMNYVVTHTELVNCTNISINGKDYIRMECRQELSDASDITMSSCQEILKRINAGQSVSITDVAYAIIKDIVNLPQEFIKQIGQFCHIIPAKRGERTVIITMENNAPVYNKKSIEHDPFKLNKEYTNEHGSYQETTTISHSTETVSQLDQCTVQIQYGESIGDIHTAADTKVQTYLRASEITTDTEKSLTKTKETSWKAKIFGGEEIVSPETTHCHSASKTELLRVEGPVADEMLKDARLSTEERQQLNAASLGLDTDQNDFSDINDEHAGRQFDTGMIDFVPLGALATMASKKMQGFDIEGSDMLWGAVDVLSVAGVGFFAKTLAKTGNFVIKSSKIVYPAATASTPAALVKNTVKTAIRKAPSQVTATVKDTGNLVKSAVKSNVDTLRNSYNYVVTHSPQETLREFGSRVKGTAQQIENVARGENVNPLHKIHGLEAGSHVNKKWAGQTVQAKDMEVAAKYPKGVTYTKEGFPDFSPYVSREVEIPFTGKRNLDFHLANKQCGVAKTPEGFVWHHHENGKTMQLIPRDLHNQFHHTGGYALDAVQKQNVRNISLTGIGSGVGINAGGKLLHDATQAAG